MSIEESTAVISDEVVFIDTLTLLFPGDGDDPGERRNDSQDDWSDIDDEDFEDMALDDDDLHEIELDNDIFDPEDDDHMPDGDDL
jgi:hypothetical protein